MFIARGEKLVLPAETEERVKRRALTPVKITYVRWWMSPGKIPQLAEYFARGDKESARQLLSEIKKGQEEVIKARQMVSQELAEIGAILISREDFLQFTNLIQRNR